MVKAVFMDVGKTIVTNRIIDFKKGLRAVYDLDESVGKIDFSEYLRVNQALRKVSFDVARENNTEVKISTFLEALNEITGIKCNMSKEQLEWFFQCNLIEEELIDGVVDFLEYLKKEGLIVFAVSNSCMTCFPIIDEFKEFDILEYFNDVISSADIGYRKPRKEIFDYAYGRLLKINNTIKKEEVVFIGNDYNCDVVGSYNAGFIPVWYNVKDEKKDDNSFSFFSVRNYQELISLFDLMKK